MDVNQVYKIVLYCVSKNNQDGYVSPDDFNVVINTAQRSYLDFLLGEYQKYQVQRPVAIVEFGQNERIRQSLSALIYGTVLSPNPVTGIAPYPSDYEYNDAMWSQYGFYNIRFIQQDRKSSYYRSVIDPVDTNPFYVINHEGLEFSPANIGSARMSYVRTPPSITWGYVLDSNGLPAYNPSTSQDPIWADTDILEIIARALSIIGVNLQFPMVIQYSNEVKQAGQ